VNDLAEKCQEEMNLINCLKDCRQGGFEDTLSRIETMLSKKVSSIRGLQSQLKTSTATSIIMPSVPAELDFLTKNE
jgi:hypothetical protein